MSLLCSLLSVGIEWAFVFCFLQQTFEVLSDEDAARKNSVMIADPTSKQKARDVDKVARKLFPAAFIVFNFAYWLTYVFWKPVA